MSATNDSVTKQAMRGHPSPVPPRDDSIYLIDRETGLAVDLEPMDEALDLANIAAITAGIETGTDEGLDSAIAHYSNQAWVSRRRYRVIFREAILNQRKQLAEQRNGLIRQKGHIKALQSQLAALQRTIEQQKAKLKKSKDLIESSQSSSNAAVTSRGYSPAYRSNSDNPEKPPSSRRINFEKR